MAPEVIDCDEDPRRSYDYRVSVRIQIVGNKICKGLLTFYFKLWNKRIKTTTPICGLMMCVKIIFSKMLKIQKKTENKCEKLTEKLKTATTKIW